MAVSFYGFGIGMVHSPSLLFEISVQLDEVTAQLFLGQCVNPGLGLR
jgi:hypothetical protein